MGIQFTWLNEPHVLLEQFTGRVTLNDLRHAATEVDHLLRQRSALAQSQPLHTVVDVTQVTDFPANLARIKAIMPPPTHARGWLILIVPEGNLLLHFVSAFALQLRSSPHQFRAFYSRSHALDFLTAHARLEGVPSVCRCPN